MDGRKATGGKLEVRVKIREPLSGVDVHPVTEKWLVLDPVSSLSPPEKQKERVRRVFNSPGLHVCRLWKETETEQIPVFVSEWDKVLFTSSNSIFLFAPKKKKKKQCGK